MGDIVTRRVDREHADSRGGVAHVKRPDRAERGHEREPYSQEFLERLIYPGGVEGGLPVAAIYTMNDRREDFERWTKPILDTLHLYFKWSCGALPVEEVYAFDTMQREVSDRYKPTSTDHEHKVARHTEVWDSELARSREAGKRYGELLRERMR